MDSSPAAFRRGSELDDESVTHLAAAMDRHVGLRMRERRTMLGISQQQLASTIGVTYQQAQKYERGLNRVSAGRLYEIAVVLAVPVGWFYEHFRDEQHDAHITPRQRMCLELARNFAAIDNAKHQEALTHLARALADGGAIEGAAADGGSADGGLRAQGSCEGLN